MANLSWEQRHAETLEALSRLPHHPGPRVAASWATEAALLRHVHERAELLVHMRQVQAPQPMLNSQKVLLLEVVLLLLEDPE